MKRACGKGAKEMAKTLNQIRTPAEDKILYTVNTILISLFCLIVALPI